jgi:hypothetical protein
MAKNTKTFLIMGAIIVAFLLFSGKINIFNMAVTSGATVTREITATNPGQAVTVKLSFNGASGKFGGIVSETIPSGFIVSGITAQVLGASGSASGKLTGQLYEIAFAGDNIANPSVTYTLTSPSTAGTYPLTGTFAFAEGGPSGSISGAASIILCSPNCNDIGNVCTGLSFGNGCGGTCTGTKALVCTRPTNLCTQPNTVSAGCLVAPSGAQKTCDGSWAVTQKTIADTDCNNAVSNTELLIHIQKWIGNTATNTELLSVITAWVSS